MPKKKQKPLFLKPNQNKPRNFSFFCLFDKFFRQFIISKPIHKLILISLFQASLLYADPIPDKEEQRLDESIRSHYEGLKKARELLALPKIHTLPSNTIIRFLGEYPNRTGIKIIRYNVIEDPLDRLNIKSSEEKSILLEFNGSVLSRIEYIVKIEETGSSPRTYTKILDETPMDETINDLEIHTLDGISSDLYPLSAIPNSGINKSRNSFKKNFYLKLLQESLIQLNLILQLQKQTENTNQNKRINSLKNSLNY
ncbi:MAG: hypothetical protein CK427_16355 [Leptospira sp.]|nr:MAG: hypothetical protein CK427_16355 [Leptospira sp.]